MELYGPVHGSFERFCKARSYGICDFNDLMHDTLVIAFEQFENLKSKEAFLSFLFGIASKVHANFRRKRTTLSFSEVKGLENAQDTSFSMEKNFQHDELYEALDKLNEGYRTCLILHEISGFSIKETAVIQASSIDAVKQRLSRGRKLLAEALTEKSTQSIII